MFQEFLKNPDESASALGQMKEPRWNVNPSKLRAKIRTVILDLKEQEAYQATVPATVRAPRTDLDAVTTSFCALESIR